MKKRIFLLIEEDAYEEKTTKHPDKFSAKQIICAVSPNSEIFRPDSENSLLGCIEEKLGGKIIPSPDGQYGESYCLKFNVGEKGNNKTRRFAVLEIPFIDEETQIRFGS